MTASPAKPSETPVRRQAEPTTAAPFANWPRNRAARYVELLGQLPACALYGRVRRLLADADALMGELDQLADDLRPRGLARSDAAFAAFCREYGAPDLGDEIAAVRVALRCLTGAAEGSLPPVEIARPKSR